MIIHVFLYWNWKEEKSQAVFTDNHMNIYKKNHPQLLWQEQPFIWPMVIQIGLGTGMYVSTYSVLFRFGIFVSLNCIPFQFLCTFHFVLFCSVLFRFGKFRFISFRSVSVYFVLHLYKKYLFCWFCLQITVALLNMGNMKHFYKSCKLKRKYNRLSLLDMKCALKYTLEFAINCNEYRFCHG
jgi:hypothetical protein